MSKTSDFVPEKVAFSSFMGQKDQGKTLLDFLCSRFTYFAKEQWLERLHAGDVQHNSCVANGSELLNMGDEVRYMALTRPEPRIPRNIPVLFEDEDLIVVNKPPHLPVHPSGRYLRNTMIHLLQDQRKLPMLILAHRLDRETSGVCVLSKSRLGKDKMYWQFFKHEVEKVYWALVWGRPEKTSGVVDAPIGDAKGLGSQIRIKKAVGGSDSKSARTKYHVLGTRLIEAPQWMPPQWPSLQNVPNKGPWPVSLVECRPITGRTNQIRVHMAHLGCGLLGDKLYDPNEEIFIEMRSTPPDLENAKDRKGESRKDIGFMNLSDQLKRRLVLDAHALHAKSLGFRHPRTGKWMVIEAPAPKSWQGLYSNPSASNSRNK